jgi:hypothetical protein
MHEVGINYLVSPADGPPLVESVDSRRSALLRTVLALEISLLPNPFFSLSLGTGGPSCAGELMLMVLVVAVLLTI